jgi:hypothetical protein
MKIEWSPGHFAKILLDEENYLQLEVSREGEAWNWHVSAWSIAAEPDEDGDFLDDCWFSVFGNGMGGGYLSESLEEAKKAAEQFVRDYARSLQAEVERCQEQHRKNIRAIDRLFSYLANEVE